MSDLTRLKLYEPKDIVPMAHRNTNDEQNIQIEGNSILSLVYVHSMDPGATLLIEYYDSGAGTSLGEENLVGSHDVINAAGSSRTLITRMTNKTKIKWTITGGDVYFGVYAFVVSNFASDLDEALVEDNVTANIANSSAILTAIYDSVLGKFFFARGSQGIQDVNVVGSPGSATAGGAVEVPLDDTNWTELPPVPRSDRVTIAVQNQSGIDVKLNEDNATVGYVGVLLRPDDQRIYSNVDPSFKLYAKAASGTPSVLVEELTR